MSLSMQMAGGRSPPSPADYDYPLNKKSLEAERAPSAPKPGQKEEAPPTQPKAAPGRKTREQKRAEAEARNATSGLRSRVRKVEEKLGAALARKEEMERLMADPAAYEKKEAFFDLLAGHGRVKQK